MEITESRITRQQSNSIDISTWFESTRFHKCEYIRIYFKITSILLLSTILASCGNDIPESNSPPVFTSAKFVSYQESEPDLSYVANAKDADGDTVTVTGVDGTFTAAIAGTTGKVDVTGTTGAENISGGDGADTGHDFFCFGFGCWFEFVGLV